MKPTTSILFCLSLALASQLASSQISLTRQLQSLDFTPFTSSSGFVVRPGESRGEFAVQRIRYRQVGVGNLILLTDYRVDLNGLTGRFPIRSLTSANSRIAGVRRGVSRGVQIDITITPNARPNERFRFIGQLESSEPPMPNVTPPLVAWTKVRLISAEQIGFAGTFTRVQVSRRGTRAGIESDLFIRTV